MYMFNDLEVWNNFIVYILTLWSLNLRTLVHDIWECVPLAKYRQFGKCGRVDIGNGGFTDIAECVC